MAEEKIFSSESESAKTLLNWFNGLDLGQRARLRRCHEPRDVVFEPSFHRLAARVPDIDPNRLARIAWTVSHLKGNDSRSLGKAFKDKLSELRFRRILSAEDRDELAHDLRAAVRLIDNRANILELARVIYFWGDIERRRFATEYYGESE